MQRRSFLRGLGLVAAASAVVAPTMVMAADAPVSPNELNIDAAVKAITGGKEVVVSDKVKMKAPEIAENGAVVPVKVHVDHPMEEANYVKAIHVLNKGNGNSRCADVMLTPANAKGYFATRVKLSKTQDVVALVELSDGTFIQTAKSVKVTIGGCG